MVGLSGGKDSWALLQMLDNLRQRAPIEFSLVAVNVDSGYKDFKHDVIARTCEERGWEYRIEHTSIGEVMDDLLEANATPCSLCARLRRGVLYRIATEVGATKIALGHHLDDFIETLLLNLFFAGALKAMPARLVSDNGEHVVIRPLAYVGEDEARLYCEGSAACRSSAAAARPAATSSLQRQRVKRLIMDLERRASGRQAVDAQGARQRHAAPPARHAPQPERRAARQRRAAARRGDGVAADSDPALAATIAADACGPSSSASPRPACCVGDRVTGEIGRGLLVLVGVGRDDTAADVAYIAGKIRDMRVFEGEAGKPMDRSVVEVGGESAGGVAVHALRRRAQRAGGRRSTRPRRLSRRAGSTKTS